MKRFIKLTALLLAVLCLFVSCKKTETPETKDDFLKKEGNPEMLQFSPLTEGETLAVMHTSLGDITLRFFPDQAPKAVINFINHAADGYYDGTTFHRVFDDFMIQGGDPTATGSGGESIWGEAFEDEFSDKLYNFCGALCMANSGANTNGSQFFIVQTSSYDEASAASYVNTGWHTPQAIEQYKKVGGCFWLDGKHTVFGQVVSGMDVVDAIAKVEANSSGKPVEDVVINSIDITTYSYSETSSEG